MSGCYLFRVLIASTCVAAYAASAQAVVVTVDCGKKNSKTINATLATLDKNVANTINIAGACIENVVIKNFKDLTLAGAPGASINDPTPLVLDDNNVLDVGPQSTVTIRSLTINGGINGLVCSDQSNCRLEDATVQGASGDGVGSIRAFVSVLGNSLLQNNAGSGLGAFSASNIFIDQLASTESGPYPVVQNNGEEGFRVWDGSFLRVTGATIQGNVGSGVAADIGSNLQLLLTTITGNGGDGVTLRASSARLRFSTTITGNAGNGINVGNLSFLRLQGSRNVSGNGPPVPVPTVLDVNCTSMTAATTGVTSPPNPAGVGTTNCIEPAP